MGDYNFWQDFFDTYQSLSDWMKALWLVVPPVFVLGFTALMMHFRIVSKQADRSVTGELIYSVHRDDEDQLHIVSHVRQIEGKPTLLVLDPPSRDAHAPNNPARHI